MRQLDPFLVAARLGAKYRLSESQEQLLRGTLSGLPEEIIQRFENRRRSLRNIREAKDAMFRVFTWYDVLHCIFARWRNERVRLKELRRRTAAEARRKLYDAGSDSQPGKNEVIQQPH